MLLTYDDGSPLAVDVAAGANCNHATEGPIEACQETPVTSDKDPVHEEDDEAAGRARQDRVDHGAADHRSIGLAGNRTLRPPIEGEKSEQQNKTTQRCHGHRMSGHLSWSTLGCEPAQSWTLE